MLRTHITRLVVSALSLALVAPLSGCLVAGNTGSRIDELSDPSIQDALDQTSDALGDVADALDQVQSDIAGAINDVTGTLEDLSDLPSVLTDLLGKDGVLSKAQTVTVEDAQTGEVLATYDDASDISQLTDTLSGMDYAAWRLVASRPDSPEEFIVRVSQTETLKLGQDPDTLATNELFTITTFADSPVIELDIASLSFTPALELPEADIACIRGLV